MKSPTNYISTDMHSDGVRFTEEQKKILKENKKVIKKVKTCAYSGLPSLEHYITETK